MNYIKCKFCNNLFDCDNINNHMNNCNPNWCEDYGLIYCYSCGKPYDKNSQLFTISQLNKQNYARCKQCIQENKLDKYARYNYNYKKLTSYTCEIMDKLSLNKQLEYYIEVCDEVKVFDLLKKGANPNYCRQMTIDNLNDRCVLLYDIDGLEKEEPDTEILQPKTPLRLCIFFLCNLLNTESDFQKLYNISKMLIEFGANRNDAFTYYRSLYGDKSDNNIWWKKIYDLITH
jgi:hypothetical protein